MPSFFGNQCLLFFLLIVLQMCGITNSFLLNAASPPSTEAPTSGTTLVPQNKITQPTDKTQSLEFFCDFEDLCEPCAFDDSNNDTFDWTKHLGPTATSGTGPSQAFKGLYYKYIETSSPRALGDYAILDTVNYKLPASSFCLGFAYHMYGMPGSLVISAGERGGNLSEIVTLVGNKGDAWLTYIVGIPKYSDVVVEFKGTKGSSYQGDIAIDDIQLTVGACTTAAPTHGTTLAPQTTDIPTPGPTDYTGIQVPTPGTLFASQDKTTTIPAYCEYKGVIYSTGQRWNDGCDYICICFNGIYQCSERCATFSQIPAVCILVPDPNDVCCRIPSCTTPYPGFVLTNPPTSGPVPTPAVQPSFRHATITTFKPFISQHQAPCVSGWSQWIDEKNPATYSPGDKEKSASEYQAANHFCTGGTINKVECYDRTICSEHSSSGNIHTCTPQAGLVCLNADNFPMTCDNYKIRYNCVCAITPDTTAAPTNGTSLTPQTTIIPTSVETWEILLLTLGAFSLLLFCCCCVCCVYLRYKRERNK